MSDPFLKDTFADQWNAFCDGEPVAPDFIENAEAAGLAELGAVKRADLEDSFAAERGIELGGSVWHLTAKGRARYEAAE